MLHGGRLRRTEGATRGLRLSSAIGAIGIATALLAACGSSSHASSASSPTQGTSGAQGGSASKATGAPIIVGEDWDNTSADAAFTDVTAKTLKFAVDYVNSHGGVLGRPIKLIFGNDQSQPSNGPAVTEQLVNAGAKFLLYNEGTDYGSKATIQKLGVPSIGVTDVVPTFADPPDNTYTYEVASQLSNWAAVYCGAWKATGVKTIGVLRDDSATTAGLDKILFPQLQKCVNIVDVETASGSASDLTAPVARLIGHHPDAILVADLGGPFEILAQDTIYQLAPKMTRYSLATIVNEPSTWKLASPGALNGVISMGSLNPNNPNTKKLNAMLTAAYGKGFSMTAFDANAWDTVQIMKQAMVASGNPDNTQKVNQAMQSISSYTASFGQPGYTLSFSPTKHSGANGLCGLVLEQFGANNKPDTAFSKYQPSCS